MQLALVILIILLAVFTQSLTGFGSGLVAMALLPAVIGIRLATPLVAAVGISLEAMLLLRYHSALNLRAVWRLIPASVIGIPIGIVALRQLNERLVLGILGFVIAAYALYALLGLRLPELKHPAWAVGAGFLAGLLGGAYNTSGPPVILYGDSRRWPPAEFKSNLTGFFLMNSLFTVSGHVIGGNYTADALRLYAWAIPAILLGFFAGISLDRRLNPQIFRKVVLAVLVATGARLMLG
jgi:uncharacterized membrane protein YfcA